MKNTILTIIAALGLSFASSAATVGVDTVSNYGTSWANGSDPASSPFSNWNLSTSGNAGFYIGAPAVGMANLGSSFAMYGNFTSDDLTVPGDQSLSGYANAQRTFDDGPLAAGQSFKISLATAYRDGAKGINLLSDNLTQLFNFNVTSGAYYAGGALLSWAYSASSQWDLTATQVSSTQLEVTIVRGSEIYTSGLIIGALNGFKLYAGDLGGSEGERNLYANNLQIIPEPSTPLLMGLGLAGLFALRRVRKNG
jgi:hypothetical protein